MADESSKQPNSNAEKDDTDLYSKVKIKKVEFRNKETGSIDSFKKS